jgi:hypothetical protein
MRDDQSSPQLARRVPGATRAAPRAPERPVLPEALLERMQAVVSAAHAQAVEERGLANEEQSRRPRAVRQDHEDRADDYTPLLPRLAASGAVVSPASNDTGVQPDRAANPAVAALPERVAQLAPGRRRHRPAVLIASALVLVAGGSLAAALSAHGSRPAASAPGPAVAAPTLAVAWVAHQVSRSATLACDPVMCRALRASGVDKLLVLGPTTPTPRRSQLIVATAAVRQEFGASLASAYAPSVIASFGSGNARVDIRVVAPDGPVAYQAALDTDLQNRKHAGADLLGSPLVVASASARRQMLAGQVTSQLLALITNVAALHPVDILAFGDSAPGASPGIPLRSAALAETGGAAALRSWLAFLHVQKPPYLPALTETIRLDGRPALLIEFAAPTPLGLLAS